MDAVAIRSCIVATLDADANARKRAELQLKQVRNSPTRPAYPSSATTLEHVHPSGRPLPVYPTVACALLDA